MSTTGYVIAFNDLQKPGYMNFGVLSDTYANLKDAELAMAHRAEEALEELITADIDAGREEANYELKYDDDRLSVAVVDIDGGFFSSRVIHTILTIQTITV